MRLVEFDNSYLIDIESYHAASLREEMANTLHVYEDLDDFKEMSAFLSSIRSASPIVGKTYIYVSVVYTPIMKICDIKRFGVPRQLISTAPGYHVFDINGRAARITNMERSFLKQLLLESSQSYTEMKTQMVMRFDDWKINDKLIDQLVDESIEWIER